MLFDPAVSVSNGLRPRSRSDASESLGRVELTSRSCKKHYHMSCLKPPLLAKPAKGYSWVCIPCSLQRHKDVEEQKFHFMTGSAPKPAKVGVRVKEKPSATSSRPDTAYRGWPWRYFG